MKNNLNWTNQKKLKVIQLMTLKIKIVNKFHKIMKLTKILMNNH